MANWYPEKKEELTDFIEKSFAQKIDKPNNINGLIVPHAGYVYSGMVAGKAFSLLKNMKIKKAVIFGPSHYEYLNDIVTSNNNFIKTPIGKIKISDIGLNKSDIENEHSINNQVPFLQVLDVEEIIPIMVGKITDKQAEEYANKISNIKDSVYVFSTDLSHFLPYDQAIKKDKKSIEIIENLDKNNYSLIDACGIYPLKILFHLCKILKVSPRLIEYKNSGDITGDKSSVVGYASFYF